MHHNYYKSVTSAQAGTRRQLKTATSWNNKAIFPGSLKTGKQEGKIQLKQSQLGDTNIEEIC